ncbi:lytic polysaccharide monooxygenase auxiliary activity family 9 protein [Wenjunlia tyrosinilytica]|uniref:Chitin-binding type-4 domain-containing protein n=1 Tax=Wenjunlia tyrosinilytica TaxID=1544741 RepID=A0A918DUD2_9ACTN|nr:lytic polysaccharide monooxygenase [Wenjunlia tyrosinilytica]GGO84365.1 hypothetical protein GCM10012280_15680 [Wenjunlia tyrosinilytica]
MTVHRHTAAATVTAITPLLLTAVAAGPALAHGAPTDPMSRAAACGPVGGAKAGSAACRASVAANGGRTFADWDNLRVAGVAGRDRQVIPDGKLCSAGLDAYKGLDIARADWPATTLGAGRAFTLSYRTTIPHKGSFSLYLTRDTYDPTKPLTWADLESRPFLTVADPPLTGGAYRIKARMPQARAGRHVLYTVWHNTETPDTYYSCSDIVLSGGADENPGSTGAGTDGNGGSDRSGSSKDSTATGGADTGGAGDDAAGKGASDNGGAQPGDAAPQPPSSPSASDGSAASPADPVPPAAAPAGSERDSMPMVAGIAGALALAAFGVFAVVRRRRS